MSEEVGIVYNACYGGFSLSNEAFEKYLELKGIPFEVENTKYGRNHYWKEGCVNDSGAYLCSRNIPRNDQTLGKVVKELGQLANGSCAKLAIAYLPKGTLFRIDEYDGFESVATKDSYGWDVA